MLFILCFIYQAVSGPYIVLFILVNFEHVIPLVLICGCLLKDVRAHCYCASLVRTLYMTWCVPRHVFQVCAPSRNSTKFRADDLCGNLICEYFCWMLCLVTLTPTFFSADHFLF